MITKAAMATLAGRATLFLTTAGVVAGLDGPVAPQIMTAGRATLGMALASSGFLALRVGQSIFRPCAGRRGSPYVRTAFATRTVGRPGHHENFFGVPGRNSALPPARTAGCRRPAERRPVRTVSGPLAARR